MKKKVRSAYLLESLEARLLFSADLAPLPVDAGTTGADFESDLEISLQPDSAGVQEAGENTQEWQEVIFIDAGVDDYQQLIDDIESQLEKGRQFDIVNLDSDSDGIDQISAYLRQHEGIDAVHVVSHGSEDAVKLGNVWLTPDTLDAYADAIEGWQQALSSDADLLFYGCNLAADDGGQDLVNSLTLLTGADVAASDDVTGNAKLGGDWDLEYSKGSIETAVAFSPEAQQNWNGVLATFTVDTTDDTVDANPGDGVAEDASGDTSLRAAVMEANALAGADTIFLDAATYTITLNGDTDGTGDLDIRSDLSIVGVSPTQTTINANSVHRVFDVHDEAAHTVSISNLKVENGLSPASVNGAGLLVRGIANRPDVHVDNVWFSDNDASGAGAMGGAISNSADLTVTNTLIEGNSAPEGGGVWNASTGVLTMQNVTLSGNDATVGDGGGLFNEGNATMRHVTVTANSAVGAGGGVIHDNGAVSTDIGNSIIAGNSAASAPDITNTIGNITSSGGNIIQDATGTGSDFAPSEIGINPLLGGLTDNGGNLMTHAPAAVQAIDAADPTMAPNTDQRGFLRGDGSPDIGAHEVGASAAGTADYLDQFNAIAYNGNDGTLSWTNDWQEIGESNGAGIGAVSVWDEFGDDGLYLWGANNIGAWRQADLSGATQATLSFNWAMIQTELGDQAVLQIATDGVVWTTLDTFDGPLDHSSVQSASYDISAFIDSNTRIRFETVSGFSANDVFFADNVSIELSTSPPVVATLSPVKDTWITINNPMDNFGADAVIRMDEKGSGLGEGHVLLQFDLSSIPAGATITSAVLQMEAVNKTNSGSSIINVYEVTEAWDEGSGGNNDATWNNRQTGQAWGTAGGSVGSTSVASLTTSAIGGHTWDITELVQDWQSGDKINNGMMLVGEDPGDVIFDYDSREGSTPPKLVITHSIPVNTPPTAANLTSTSSYNEGDATVAITDIVVSDADTGETITATLTLNDTGTGSLSANNGASYTAGTGVWTITDTVANANLALANLVFTPLVDNDVDTTITTHIEDAAGAGPADGTITLDVTPADITADLVVHLEFSEGSGTTAFDSTAYGNDAYLSGAQDWVSGAVGGGFHFNYSDGEDFFEINNAASVENVQEGSFTLAAWFKADNVPPTSDAYGIIVKEGWHTGLWYNANKQFVFEHTLVGPSYPRVVSANTYDPGTYHHIAVTLDRPSGTMTLYIDGVLENTSSFTPGAASWEYNSETWKVGTARDMFPTPVDFPAKGSVDDVRIYSRAITAPESTELFNLGNSAPTASGTYNLAGTDEDTTSMAVQVSAILTDASITAGDVDGDTLGVAVSATTGVGNWQYSTDGATGWTGFGTVGPNAALLLSETTWVRYVPDGANGESVGFDFLAWDQSTDLASINGTPRFGDTTPGGGTTAYSTGNASVALTVGSVNDAPTATNLSSTSAYNEGDASVAITDIVVSDVDTGETITATLTLNNTATGSLSANDDATYDGGTGVWTITDTVANVNLAMANLFFTPTINNDVDTTISVNIDDGDEDGSGPLTGTITLDVTPVNDAPTVVTNTPLNVPEEATRTITSAYLETTDPDNSPDQIIYTLTGLPSGGSVRLSGTPLTSGQTFTQDDINNNRVTYRDSDDGETTSFTLTVSDGNTTLPAFSFSINGQPINDAPVVTAPGSALNATEQIGLAIHGKGFSVSDLDEAGAGAIATLTVGEGTISVVVGNSGVSIDSGDGTGTVALSGSIAQLNALLTGASTGTITYLNNSDNPGSNTMLTLTVNDQGNTGTDPGLTGDGSSEEGTNNVIINIASVNDAPIATADSFTVDEGSTTNLNLAGNDSDADDGLDLASITIVSGPGNGTIDSINADGTVDYTHDGSETLSDSFTYTIDDPATATSNTVTVSLTITPLNDAPIATADSFTVDEGSTTNLNLAGNDSDADDGLDLASITIVSGPGNGTIDSINADGTVDYTHDGSETLSDSFTYTIDDLATATSNTVTVSLTITPLNDAPIATADSFTVDEGSTTNLNLAGNDSDADDGLDLASITIVSGPGNGTIDSINADGTVDYTHDGSETLSDSFTYTIDDLATATSNTVTVSLTITPLNDAPIATADSFTVDEGSTTNLNLAGNDSDADDGLDLASITIVSGPGNGTIDSINADGTVDYTHDGSETLSDSFTYTIDDLATATSNTVTVSLAVTNINDPGTVTIDNSTPAQGDTLTANVIDPDGASGAISYQWFSDGVVIGGATGKTYTTTQGDVGAIMTVTSIYTDDQGSAESLTASTAAVTNVNDTPIAVNDNLSAIEDQSMTFTSVTDLLGNDSDIDGDTLTLSGFSQPANGSLADNGDGTVTYTSAGNFSGVDSFTYTISDGNGETAAGTAIIVVTPVGDTPRVTNVSTNAEVQSGLINIDRNANDGAEVTHFKVSGITNGTLYLADGVTRIDNGDFISVGQGQAGLRFTPAANSTADGSFNVESSEDGVSVASQSGIATSIISILTTAPQQSEPVPSLPPSDPEEVVSEETELEENEELEDIADETDLQTITDDMASVEVPQNAKAPGIKKASLVPGISVFKRADLNSNHDKTTTRSTLLSPQTLKKLVESENLGELKTALRKLDITTLHPDVYELVRGSLDAVQEEIGKEILIGKTVVGSAIATSVGLSAGYVVWMLKGGSLLASVLSSLPAWQLADPLAILVGTKEDEDEDEDDDTLETIIKDGSRRNEDKKSKTSELNKHKKEPTKR